MKKGERMVKTGSSPCKWAWTRRTGFVSWDCPRVGKREGNPTGTGRRWDPPTHTWGPAVPSPESAAPAPRPVPSTSSSGAPPPLGRLRTCVAFFQKRKQSLASVAALLEHVQLSVMSFVALSGRPGGGVFLHTGSEWGVVSLSLVEGTCFLERKSLLQDRGTQEAPLGLVRVTEAKRSKPGPTLERVHPAGRQGAPGPPNSGGPAREHPREWCQASGCFSGLLEAGGSFPVCIPQVGHRASQALLEGGNGCVSVLTEGPPCGVDATQFRLLGQFRVALRNQIK